MLFYKYIFFQMKEDLDPKLTYDKSLRCLLHVIGNPKTFFSQYINESF